MGVLRRFLDGVRMRPPGNRGRDRCRPDLRVRRGLKSRPEIRATRAGVAYKSRKLSGIHGNGPRRQGTAEGPVGRRGSLRRTPMRPFGEGALRFGAPPSISWRKGQPHAEAWTPYRARSHSSLQAGFWHRIAEALSSPRSIRANGTGPFRSARSAPEAPGPDYATDAATMRDTARANGNT